MRFGKDRKKSETSHDRLENDMCTLTLFLTRSYNRKFSHARRPTTPAIKDSENGRCLLLECCTYFRGFQIDN